MRTATKAAVIAALLLVLAATSGCILVEAVKGAGKGDKDVEMVPRTAKVVVLMDLSKSTLNETTRNEYRTMLGRVVGRLYYGDKISIWSVDKDSIKNSTPLTDDEPWPRQTKIAQSDQQQKVADRKFRAENPLDQLRASVVRDFTPHLTDKTKGSDLLGAMGIASRSLDVGKDKDSERWLIVFSDMLINDGRWSMYKKFDAKKMLDQVREEEGIPQLTGVNVIIAGAGGKDKQQYKKVEDFWLAYLEEAGASMPPAHYGTKLPSELLDQINDGLDFETADVSRLQAVSAEK